MAVLVLLFSLYVAPSVINFWNACCDAIKSYICRSCHCLSGAGVLWTLEWFQKFRALEQELKAKPVSLYRNVTNFAAAVSNCLSRILYTTWNGIYKVITLPAAVSKSMSQMLFSIGNGTWRFVTKMKVGVKVKLRSMSLLRCLLYSKVKKAWGRRRRMTVFSKSGTVENLLRLRILQWT